MTNKFNNKFARKSSISLSFPYFVYILYRLWSFVNWFTLSNACEFVMCKLVAHLCFLFLFLIMYIFIYRICIATTTTNQIVWKLQLHRCHRRCVRQLKHRCHRVHLVHAVELSTISIPRIRVNWVSRYASNLNLIGNWIESIV